MKELLKPYPSERMILWPVSPKLNSPKNDSPDLLEPVPEPDTEPVPMPPPWHEPGPPGREVDRPPGERTPGTPVEVPEPQPM